MQGLIACRLFGSYRDTCVSGVFRLGGSMNNQTEKKAVNNLKLLLHSYRYNPFVSITNTKP